MTILWLRHNTFDKWALIFTLISAAMAAFFLAVWTYVQFTGDVTLSRTFLGYPDPDEYRKPFPLPPITQDFLVRLEDQERIIISVTFYYPQHLHSQVTTQRIIELIASTLAKFASHCDELPEYAEVEAVIDDPLTSLAHELDIPVLYASAKSIHMSGAKGTTIGDLIL
jgi:hypothetical protein